MSVTKGDTHLAPAEAAEFIGVTVRTLLNWRRNRIANNSKPHGPEFLEIGGRVCYLRTELTRYMNHGDRRDERRGKRREGLPLLPLPAKIVPPPPR